VASKYDWYWAERLASIRAALVRAANGQPVVIGLPDLTRLGKRQSWYGSSDVRGRDVIGSSMAHATSLGRTIAASGVCAAWPETTFRFTIDSAGDMLTISAAGGRVQPASPSAGPARAMSAAASGFAEGAPAAGPAYPAADYADVADDAAVERFHLALHELAEILGGPRRLRDSHGTDGWPTYGVYFFYEPGEVRTDGSDRVVRVGTHALTATSQATLWGRLRQHRGHLSGHHPGGGNHRASVFRRHVGAALIRREKLPNHLLASWLDRHGPRPGWEAQEAQIEQAVSRHMGAMPFLWLSVADRARRGSVERNSIALTSRLAHGPDPSSASWLGRHADRTEIRQSGLWNIDHVRHRCEAGFLDLFGQLIKRQD